MIVKWQTIVVDCLSVQKIILQNAEVSKHSRENFCHLLDEYIDIMSSSSSEIGSIQFIAMDIKADPTFPPVASNPYTLPLKHQKWVQK